MFAFGLAGAQASSFSICRLDDHSVEWLVCISALQEPQNRPRLGLVGVWGSRAALVAFALTCCSSRRQSSRAEPSRIQSNPTTSAKWIQLSGPKEHESFRPWNGAEMIRWSHSNTDKLAATLQYVTRRSPDCREVASHRIASNPIKSRPNWTESGPRTVPANQMA